MITLITGNHPRHIFFGNQISKIIKIENWVLEKRENFVTGGKEKNNLSVLENLHFKKREKAELKFFGNKKKISNNVENIIEINKEELNNGSLKEKLKKSKNINLMSYGCHKIEKNLLDLFKLNKINIHGGLSPWYRGVITHFWPSYLLEPEYTGMTMHNLSNDIDGGDVLHQYSVKLNEHDGIHENACRCVKAFSNQLIKIINNNHFKAELRGIRQNTHGRIWTSRMWNPMVLNVVYKFYKDRINSFCLKTRKIKKPKLDSIFL